MGGCRAARLTEDLNDVGRETVESLRALGSMTYEPWTWIDRSGGAPLLAKTGFVTNGPYSSVSVKAKAAPMNYMALIGPLDAPYALTYGKSLQSAPEIVAGAVYLSQRVRFWWDVIRNRLVAAQVQMLDVPAVIALLGAPPKQQAVLNSVLSLALPQELDAKVLRSLFCAFFGDSPEACDGNGGAMPHNLQCVSPDSTTEVPDAARTLTDLGQDAWVAALLDDGLVSAAKSGPYNPATSMTVTGPTSLILDLWNGPDPSATKGMPLPIALQALLADYWALRKVVAWVLPRLGAGPETPGGAPSTGARTLLAWYLQLGRDLTSAADLVRAVPIHSHLLIKVFGWARNGDRYTIDAAKGPLFAKLLKSQASGADSMLEALLAYEGAFADAPHLRALLAPSVDPAPSPALDAMRRWASDIAKECMALSALLYVASFAADPSTEKSYLFGSFMSDEGMQKWLLKYIRDGTVTRLGGQGYGNSGSRTSCSWSRTRRGCWASSPCSAWRSGRTPRGSRSGSSGTGRAWAATAGTCTAPCSRCWGPGSCSSSRSPGGSIIPP